MANYQAQKLSEHLHQVFYGGNWTWVNVNNTLKEITLIHATQKIAGCNTIAALTYHIMYFVNAINNVLEGRLLNSHDKYSFDVPTLTTEEEWQALIGRVLQEATSCTRLISKLDDEILEKTFVLEKYGSYHRNILGLIEHTHYHLGQIVILKKLILDKK